MAPQRLQKIIAAAGISSRRKAEELITAGRVSVNGKIVTQLGVKADPITDTIHLDGKPLGHSQQQVYILLNKPKGYVTTVSDPEGRPTVVDLVRTERLRLYPVGRLDYNSEGLLLLTNDGNLAHLLTQPSSHVEKTYLVKVSGQPTAEQIARLRLGVSIPRSSLEYRRGGRVRTAPAKIAIFKQAENPWYEITLLEGKNRQIRKMFEEIGHPVEKIKRVKYGPLKLDVNPGEYRRLKEMEIEQLRKYVVRAQGPPGFAEKQLRERLQPTNRKFGNHGRGSRPRSRMIESFDGRKAEDRHPRFTRRGSKGSRPGSRFSKKPNR